MLIFKSTLLLAVLCFNNVGFFHGIVLDAAKKSEGSVLPDTKQDEFECPICKVIIDLKYEKVSKKFPCHSNEMHKKCIARALKITPALLCPLCRGAQGDEPESESEAYSDEELLDNQGDELEMLETIPDWAYSDDYIRQREYALRRRKNRASKRKKILENRSRRD